MESIDAQSPRQIVVVGQGLLSVAVKRRLQALGAKTINPYTANWESDEQENQATEDEPSASALLDRVLQPGRMVHALVLTDDDDGGNIDLVFAARRMRPELPIVVRIFDSALGAYLRDTLPRVQVLSVSQVAAPILAEATLKAINQSGRRLPSGKCSSSTRDRNWRIDRVLVTILVALAAMVFGSTVFFSRSLNLQLIDALYFVWTTITTVGYGDISLREASSLAKVVGMGLMFAGASFIALLFAFFTDWVVARRLDVLSGRVPVRGQGHVLVAGAGNVGFRAASLLAERGWNVVVVENNPENSHLPALRSAAHHVIVADAAAEETLDLVRIEAASAVLAVTDTDAVNLHVALQVRARCPSLPTILRVESSELSAHICQRQDGVAFALIDLAAEAFAREAMGDQQPAKQAC